MPNFVTFDDGLTYISISDVESFGCEEKDEAEGKTWIRLRKGHVLWTQWDVSEVAKRLGPVANLHY